MTRTKQFKKFQDHEIEPANEKKSSRTKKAKKIVVSFRSFGGHLFNPPQSCPFRRRAADGGVWTDLGCCISNCQEACNQYLYYIKLNPNQKQEHLKVQGVLN